jgi:drug/metabolite transporter (DMT)-like permease
MTPGLLILFIVTIGLDVVGQLWFKLGLTRLPEKTDSDHFGLFWKRVFSSPLLWAGIGTYAIELGLWLALLANAPLSFLFPLASLGYVGVLLASRLVLKETVSRRRWAGASLITLGVAIVYIAGQG